MTYSSARYSLLASSSKIELGKQWMEKSAIISWHMIVFGEKGGYKKPFLFKHV